MDNMSGTSSVVEREGRVKKTTPPAAIVSANSFKQIHFTLTMHGTEEVVDVREYTRSAGGPWAPTDSGFRIRSAQFVKLAAATRKTERTLRRYGAVDDGKRRHLRVGTKILGICEKW